MTKGKTNKGWKVANDITAKFILDNIAIDTVGWCWNWIRPLNSFGYARIKERGRLILVHRRSYELFRGAIPQDMTLDHLCRNKGCCNPDHLEVVTGSENRRRGIHRPPATHCKYGHEYADDNTIVQIQRGRPTKACRTCRNERFRRYRKEDPVRFKKSATKYRKENADKVRKTHEAWVSKNQEYIKAYRSTPEYKARASEQKKLWYAKKRAAK